tara:strand:- start:559 stop:903 length:345 start_codon:yes stop_codon:yes gene_type:complete
MTQQNKYNKGDRVQIANGDWLEIGPLFDEKSDEMFIDVVPVDCLDAAGLITGHRPYFDWGKVKSGMAFKHKGVGTVHISKESVCVIDKEGEKHPMIISMSDLIRHPEGDLQEGE